MRMPNSPPGKSDHTTRYRERVKALRNELNQAFQPYCDALAEARRKQPDLDRSLKELEQQSKALQDQPGLVSNVVIDGYNEKLRPYKERLMRVARVNSSGFQSRAEEIARSHSFRVDHWDSDLGGSFSPIQPPSTAFEPPQVDIGKPVLPWTETIDPPFPAINQENNFGDKTGEATPDGMLTVKARGVETVIADDYEITEASLADFVLVPQEGFRRITLTHHYKDGGWARVFGIGAAPAWMEIYGWFSSKYFTGLSLAEDVLWTKAIYVFGLGFVRVNEPFTQRKMTQVLEFVPDGGPVQVQVYRLSVAEKNLAGASRSEAKTQWLKTDVIARA